MLLPFARWYWRIFRPKTFGVKVLILNQADHEEVLLVRHAYGNRKKWNLPGGGYRPRRETPLQAATREVREELGVDLLKGEVIGEYRTSLEGKRDTVSFVLGTVAGKENIFPRDEITEAVWKKRKETYAEENISAVIKEALKCFDSFEKQK